MGGSGGWGGSEQGRAECVYRVCVPPPCTAVTVLLYRRSALERDVEPRDRHVQQDARPRDNPIDPPSCHPAPPHQQQALVGRLSILVTLEIAVLNRMEVARCRAAALPPRGAHMPSS